MPIILVVIKNFISGFKPSATKLARPLKAVYAAYSSPFVTSRTFVISIHLVTPTKVAVTSFLCNSYGHPQDQTVPSSRRDAPCPVVTPSRSWAWLGVICKNNISHFFTYFYTIFESKSYFVIYI